jgi:TonB family protein
MRVAETWVFSYVLNALWQVPLVFAVAWLAARLARHGAGRGDVAWEHRIWTVALVLEAVLPACSLQWGAVLRWMSSLGRGPSAHGASVSVVMGAGRVQGGMRLTAFWLAAAMLVYAGTVLYFAARLGVGVYRTLRLRALASPLVLAGEAQASFERMGRVFGVAGVVVASSAAVRGPVVLGIRRPMLLLPQAMLDDIASDDFAAALAHEFAHLRRRDFAKNLAYELLSLPVAFHPLLWPTRAAVDASREALCDALAAEAVQGRQRYARSLLRLAAGFSGLKAAGRTRSISNHAIGIFDANSFASGADSFAAFERRVMKLTEKQREVRGVRRVAMATLSVALAFGACGTALALRLQVAGPVPQTSAAQAQPVMLVVPRQGNGTPAQTIPVDIPSGTSGGSSIGTGGSGSAGPVRMLTPTSVAADQTVSGMQVPGGVMAGNIETKVNPVYPQAAKDAKIQGAVVLKAVIGKDGTIKSLKLVSGPDELAQSAWDAVKQWTYKPYLLNGQPTEVETTITVNYMLASDAPAPPPAPEEK